MGVICGFCEVKLLSARKTEIYQEPAFDIRTDGKSRETIQKEYIDRYGDIIDDVNKQLKNWNDEWDDYYSGVMHEGDSMWNMYGQYLAAKENMICAMHNLLYPDSRIKMACINRAGEPKIIGIVDNDPDLYFETFF